MNFKKVLLNKLSLLEQELNEEQYYYFNECIECYSQIPEQDKSQLDIIIQKNIDDILLEQELNEIYESLSNGYGCCQYNKEHGFKTSNEQHTDIGVCYFNLIQLLKTINSKEVKN